MPSNAPPTQQYIRVYVTVPRVLLVLNKPVRRVIVIEEGIHIAAQIGPTDLLAVTKRDFEEGEVGE